MPLTMSGKSDTVSENLVLGALLAVKNPEFPEVIAQMIDQYVDGDCYTQKHLDWLFTQIRSIPERKGYRCVRQDDHSISFIFPPSQEELLASSKGARGYIFEFSSHGMLMEPYFGIFHLISSSQVDGPMPSKILLEGYESFPLSYLDQEFHRKAALRDVNWRHKVSEGAIVAGRHFGEEIYLEQSTQTVGTCEPVWVKTSDFLKWGLSVSEVDYQALPDGRMKKEEDILDEPDSVTIDDPFDWNAHYQKLVRDQQH